MQKLYDVMFASSNKNKYHEVKKILNTFGINIGFFKCDFIEIQSAILENIARKKVFDAFSKCKKPVIIEDDGIFIESLKGFPGPYSSYAFSTIGNKGILKLVNSNRKATFRSIIAYCDSRHETILFNGKVNGEISKNSRGKGWGYDPIFIPNGKTQTFAELTDKNSMSHRYKALRKFSSWFLNK